MKERFQANDPRSMMLRFHAQTAGSTLTAQQPENNVVRVAYQALAAVLGGCQSLHTNSRDEALALPTEESVTIALRTQQILAFESGVADSADPLAGSYAVESLTLDLEREAMKLIERIDDMGGALRAIEEGWIQSEIGDSAYIAQRDLEELRSTVVGVNRFKEKEEHSLPLLTIDENVEREQIERLRAFRSRRETAPELSGKAAGALEELRAAATGDRNLLYPIVDAVRHNCTIGEIVNTLRETFGDHREHGF